MAADGVLAWRDELDVLKQRLGHLFIRPEPRRQAGLYLETLRSWHDWYRHITLAMLALAFPVAMRVKLNALPPPTGNDAPSRPMVDLSVCEIRHLISRFLLVVGLALEPIFAWSVWRRIHQAVAKLCHWKARGLCPA